jgi:hypothetical protein
MGEFGTVSYRYEQYRPRPTRRGRSCLISLTVLIWVAVLGCVGLRYFVRPLITDYFNQQVAVSIAPDAAVDNNVGEALQDSLQQVPIPVDIPVGTLTISEEQANSYLAEYRGRLEQIDDMRLRFVPGEVQVDVTAGFLTGTARTQPTVSDGRIIASNARLDEPLGSFFAVQPLMQALVDRINDEVAVQGKTVTAVQIEQGVAVVTVQ